MRITNYKKVLFSNDIPAFIDMLQEMKCDNNTYAEIKRLNNLLKEHINDLGDEVLERDNYRIIPYKHSLTYLFSLYLQSRVDFAEYKVKMLKYNKCYSSFKNERRSDDCWLEDNFSNIILDTLIHLLSDYNSVYNSNDMMDTNGFDNINQIDYILEKSNINIAFKNIHKLIDRESESTGNDFFQKIAESDCLEYFQNSIKESIHASQSYVNSTNSLNKVNIVHIPLFNNTVPSVYIYDINTILVSVSLNNDTIERRLISEFGMYFQYQITHDIRVVPKSFAIKHPILQGMQLQNLYYDLFAYKMLKGTEVEDKDILAQDLKSIPDSLQRLDDYAKYFDILLEE